MRQPSSSRVRGTADLLLEVGIEELPYQFLKPALEALAESAARLLKESRLVHGRLRIMGTPRRLVVTVESMAERQASALVEAMGPSRAVAFDEAGQPTKAAIGFANAQGVGVKDLEIRPTPKGEYVFAVKRDPGRPALAVLSELLPRLVSGLSFPKTMKWNGTGLRFARPIRWIVALYGGRVIPFRIGDIRAGNVTRGHRFLGVGRRQARQGIRVASLKAYLKVLPRHGVIVDQDHRRSMILAQIAQLAKAARGQVHRDEDLEDLIEQAVFAVEYPQAILGGFNPQFLALPQEVLITSMKEHQGFFSLVRSDGTLLPNFIAVTNMKLPDMRGIREGNERVLGARLADAKFFYDEDRKVPLADRVSKLSGVIFHQKLGTLHQKVERLRELASTLGATLGLDRDTINACRRAAELCKADLLTGVVGEFPTLQGIMGGEYARHGGEPPEVAGAIRDHYKPRFAEDELPATPAGRVLSLADRLDTVVAFLAAGLFPTGSEDPFALRRHATAIVRILIEGGLRLDLVRAIEQARWLLEKQGFDALRASSYVSKHAVDPVPFIADRVRHYGRTALGLRDDVIEAVLAPVLEKERKREPTRFELMELIAKMKALQAFTVRPEFDPLMVGFKRAHRMVEKEQWRETGVDAGRFQHPSEGRLHQELLDARLRLPGLLAEGDFAGTLEALIGLKPAIDDFFVGVLVNTEEPALRANRLSLLRGIDQLFLSFADFSCILVQGTEGKD